MNDEKRPLKRLCPDCSYLLVRLSEFDGSSSLDAPGFDSRGSVENWVLLWLSLAWRALSALWSRRKKRERFEEARRLRDDVLPSDPEARICPHCLRLMLSDER
jgi:hypothetical protein